MRKVSEYSRKAYYELTSRRCRCCVELQRMKRVTCGVIMACGVVCVSSVGTASVQWLAGIGASRCLDYSGETAGKASRWRRNFMLNNRDSCAISLDRLIYGGSLDGLKQISRRK